MQSFQREIKRRLAAANEQRAREKNHLALEMTELTARHEAYARVAGRLVEQVLLPRVSAVASQFENSKLLHVERRELVGITFRHSARFPASVELKLGVTHDEGIENVIAFYDCSILPVFMKFQKTDQTSWAVEEVDEAVFAEWVESHLIQFLETYLRIEEVDQYQRESLCTDPVCGMRIRKSSAAASTEYNGIAFYFCVEECKDAFLADPSRYIAH